MHDFIILPHVHLDTKFKQQKLPAWQPIMTAGSVLPAFIAIGIVFIPLGVALLLTSNGVRTGLTVLLITLNIYLKHVGCHFWFNFYKILNMPSGGDMDSSTCSRAISRLLYKLKISVIHVISILLVFLYFIKYISINLFKLMFTNFNFDKIVCPFHISVPSLGPRGGHRVHVRPLRSRRGQHPQTVQNLCWFYC